MLKMRNIPHNVLNAKNHQHEAEIVARAGQAGAVTVATNMPAAAPTSNSVPVSLISAGCM